MVDQESDSLLPIANVGRIMKQILPPNAKISKGAKETMQECVTEFIGFVTGEASDKCHKENRKTVNGDDICWALSTLGFDNYGEAITRYLYKYREYEREKAANNNCHQGKAYEEEAARGLPGDEVGVRVRVGVGANRSSTEERDDETMKFGIEGGGNNSNNNKDQLQSFEFRIIDPKGKSPFRNP